MTTITVNELSPSTTLSAVNALSVSALDTIHGGKNPLSPYEKLKLSFQIGFAAGTLADQASGGALSDGVSDAFCTVGGWFGKGC